MASIIVIGREYPVTKAGTCLEWGTRYPKISVAGRKYHVTRLLLGVTDPQVYVRHTCDNPYCVNPDHLITGSHADNMRDKKIRGTCRKIPDWLRDECFEYAQAYGVRAAARCFGVSRTAMRHRLRVIA